MLETDKVFAGSIPENYDRYMVPLIFEPYAADIARRAASLSPSAVLETAAGSGVVTRAMAPRLPLEASYIVTDLNQPMVDYAASRQPLDTRIEWRQADALALPFENATFDLVCCQFGAMFFPDCTSAYREARRVLKPGGHFLFNVWDRIEENVFAVDVTNALAKIFPNDPPRFLARTLHSYHDTALIRSELEEAGFSRVRVCIAAVGTVFDWCGERGGAGELPDHSIGVSRTHSGNRALCPYSARCCVIRVPSRSDQPRGKRPLAAIKQLKTRMMDPQGSRLQPGWRVTCSVAKCP
jgi:ubiquinone/menaquinone biosynthesis C-methylase UbiE